MEGGGEGGEMEIGRERVWRIIITSFLCSLLWEESNKKMKESEIKKTKNFRCTKKKNKKFIIPKQII